MTQREVARVLATWMHGTGQSPEEGFQAFTAGTALMIRTKIAELEWEAKGGVPLCFEDADALELMQHHDLRTYEIVDRDEVPKGTPILKSKWIREKKLNPDGSIEKYKSRLVVMGLSWIMDYGPTFSSTARPETINTIYAWTASEDWELNKIDMKVFFLHGELDKPVYMTQPKGYEAGKDKVCKVYKSIYGMPNASRVSAKKLYGVLKDAGYVQCKSDENAFVLKDEEGKTIALIAIHVDDMLISTKTQAEFDRLAEQLMKTYGVKKLAPDVYLGVQVQRNRERREIFVHQDHRVRDIVGKYGMSKCNEETTPAQMNTVLEPALEGEEVNNLDIPYRECMGELIPLMRTRDDIRWAVTQCCGFMSKYTARHWEAVKRILRYLKGTRGRGRLYKAGEDPKLEVFVDAGWNTLSRGRSPYGYIVRYGKYGIIAAEARKTALCAMSTTEAEHYGATEAGKMIQWIRGLWDEMGILDPGPTVMWEDNQGAIALTKDAVAHARNKHYRLRQHFLRDIQERRIITVLHVGTKWQLADIFTKALGPQEFRRLTQAIMGDHLWDGV
jgi:hypothetical protein